jgi:hypothetical protein
MTISVRSIYIDANTKDAARSGDDARPRIEDPVVMPLHQVTPA